jgi:hypothetical protein
MSSTVGCATRNGQPTVTSFPIATKCGRGKNWGSKTSQQQAARERLELQLLCFGVPHPEQVADRLLRQRRAR